MLYLFAAVGVFAIAILLWRTLSASQVVGARRSTVAPDDDPDFLRRLGEQTRRRNDGEGQP